jgi:predicted transcriptional regulator
MQSQTAKQDAIEAINNLPDNVAFEEIIYRLHVLNKTYQGMRDIDAGYVVSSEELAHEIEQW